jgi:hypothetical protein
MRVFIAALLIALSTSANAQTFHSAEGMIGFTQALVCRSVVSARSVLAAFGRSEEEGLKRLTLEQGMTQRHATLVAVASGFCVVFKSVFGKKVGSFKNPDGEISLLLDARVNVTSILEPRYYDPVEGHLFVFRLDVTLPSRRHREIVIPAKDEPLQHIETENGLLALR